MYKIKYNFCGILVDHEIEYLYLKQAIDIGYWHSQYNGAEGIQIYRGSNLIAEIMKED